jgi:hypothetical protein
LLNRITPMEIVIQMVTEKYAFIPCCQAVSCLAMAPYQAVVVRLFSQGRARGAEFRNPLRARASGAVRAAGISMRGSRGASRVTR